jgi:SAM-dependent methyltransferase
VTSPHFEPRDSLYDEYYFRHGCGQPYERGPVWLSLFKGFADHIVQRIAPRTVMDVGCAIGLLVEALRVQGVEAFGTDISAYAIGQVPEVLREYCWLGSAVDPFPARYDLIVCIEVLEHLPAPQGDLAIQNLCQSTDDILFSSSPLDYREATHVNVQPPEYWAERFALHGFLRDVDFEATFLTPWAARFRRSREPLVRVVRDYERRLWPLAHENSELRRLVLETRTQAAELDHFRRLAAAPENQRWLRLGRLLRQFTDQPPKG